MITTGQLITVKGFPKACSHKWLFVSDQHEKEAIDRRLKDVFGIEYWFQGSDHNHLIIAKWYYNHYPTWREVELHISDALNRDITLKYV
jgi:hypothetical protein